MHGHIPLVINKGSPATTHTASQIGRGLPTTTGGLESCRWCVRSAVPLGRPPKPQCLSVRTSYSSRTRTWRMESGWNLTQRGALDTRPSQPVTRILIRQSSVKKMSIFNLRKYDPKDAQQPSCRYIHVNLKTTCLPSH